MSHTLKLFGLLAFCVQSVFALFNKNCPSQSSEIGCGFYDNCLWIDGGCVADECRESGNLNAGQNGCVDDTKCTFYNCPQLGQMETEVTYEPQCVKKGVSFNSCENVSANYYFGLSDSGIDTTRCALAGCSVTGYTCTSTGPVVGECDGNKNQCESNNHCKWVGNAVCMGCNDYFSQNSCLDAKYVLGVTCKWSDNNKCVYEGPVNYECDKLLTESICSNNRHCAWLVIEGLGSYCTGCDEWDIVGKDLCEKSKQLHGLSCKWSGNECVYNETSPTGGSCNDCGGVVLTGPYFGTSYCEDGPHTLANGWSNLTIGEDLTFEGRDCPYRIDHDGTPIGWAKAEAFSGGGSLKVGCCASEDASSGAKILIPMVLIFTVLSFFL